MVLRSQNRREGQFLASYSAFNRRLAGRAGPPDPSKRSREPDFGSDGYWRVGKVTSIRLTQAYTRLAGNDLHEGKALMKAYSVLANLLRSTNEGAAVVQARQPVLLPRTAADELPPYREQPWIVDERGYRKVGSRTLAPADRW